MPIKVMAAPKNALAILRQGLERHLSAGLVDAELSAVDGVSAPHRVFHLGLDRLVSDAPIATAAEFVGWRVLLLAKGQKAPASAELVAKKSALKFACVTRGAHASNSPDALAAAERWARERKDDVELALLRVPGAYCTALWLRSADGSHDVFVPIAPCPSGLKPNTPVSERELRAVLLPEAKKQLAAPPEDGGRTG